MMARLVSMVALEADPHDPEDFDVSEAEVERAVEERRARTEQVSLHLDRAVLNRFRATGPGWEARINEELRRAAP
jgi:uncharacterized protein (DUF4415 family)